LVIPDVDDLELFSRRLHRLGAEPRPGFTNTYLGRVVGGGEEAALRFLMDLKASDTAGRLGISSFLTVGMGRVPWDKKQQNRSAVARVRANYDEGEFGVFEAAATYLGKAKVLSNKKGEPFAVPDSPLPELVASNLTNDEHWCEHFHDLVAEKRDFSAMLSRKEGLSAMRDAVQNQEDRLVIQRFQKAWEMTMGALGERARQQGADFSRLVEVERERIRNDLLRTRTHEQLTGWFLNFMARASREGTPELFRKDPETFRQFLFNPRNAERLKNLLLFALVSYASDSPGDDDPSEAVLHSHSDDNQ
jgi:CRISPR-associated protein Cas8a1/Csx13